MARVGSVAPEVAGSPALMDSTAIQGPDSRRAGGLVLTVGDRVMTRRVGRLVYVDYKLGS